MHTSARSLTAVPAALAALLLTALLVLVAPLSASAHDALVDADPAPDSAVETLPEQIRLTFSAAVQPEGRTAVEVLDESGASVVEGEPVVDGAVVTQALQDGGAAGEYRVIWQITSSDGHLTSEEYVFTVTVGAEPAPGADEADEPGEADAADASDASAEEPAEAPSDEDADAADADDTTGTPADGDSFLRNLPWIIGLLVLALLGGALIAVLVRRARGGASADSEGPSER